MKTNILKVCVALAVSAVALNSCLKSPSSPPPSIPPAYLSIMYLAPTGPLVDIFFEEEKVSSTAFAAGNVTPLFNPIDKGFFSVKFKKAGSDSMVVQMPPVQYDSLNFYTIFLYNTLVNGPVNAVRIKENFSDLQANPAKAYYRFFHASPNTGAVDLYISNVKAESSRVHIDNIMHDPFNRFVLTNADYHTVEVKLAGTNTVIASLQNADLRPGNAYTFYLKGLDAGTGDKQLSLGILRAAQ